MMTFGLNRPIFAFGLMAAGVLFLGRGDCMLEVEDARLLMAERLNMQVEEIRTVDLVTDQLLREFEDRVFVVHDFRTFDLYNEARTFEIDDKRTFLVERNCNASDDADI